MTARKPAAKRAAPKPPASQDDILHDAVHAVVNTIRAGRSIGHPVAAPDLALRLQVAAEEYARGVGV